MKVIIQDLAIEYQYEGAGQVILFLHGWQDNLHTFDSVISLLPKTSKLIRLDLPGFGQSQRPKENWGIDGYVRFVKDFIQKLNLSVNTIVGHSFGGRIIIKGVATNSLQPRKIILIGSAGLAKHKNFRNSIFKILAKIGGLVAYIPPLVFWREELRKKMYRVIGSDYLSAGDLKETYLKAVQEDLTESAKNIILPTLLVWGENDTATPLRDGHTFSRIIQNSNLKVVSNSGHFVHQEKPAEVAKLIQEFI